MQNKTCTFIIPAYIKNLQYLAFLKETLNSIFLQTDNDWNVVIIDDCSPISIKNNLNDFDENKIEIITLNRRETTGYCRNLGIKWAEKNKSKYVLFNDADDITDKNRVKRVKDIFKKYAEVDVIYNDIEIIDENSLKVRASKLSKAISEIKEALKNPPVGKKCWYDIGTSVRLYLAIKELFPDEYVSEDSHTWFRYAARGNFYFDRIMITLYRIPSFVERQSSNYYVDDFNKCKIQVEIDGFNKALDIIFKEKGYEGESRTEIMNKFLLRLKKSMVKVNRYDLVKDLDKRILLNSRK